MLRYLTRFALLLLLPAALFGIPPRNAAADDADPQGWMMMVPIKPSEVDVVLHANPSLTVPAGAILTYHVVLTNRGDADAGQTDLTFPLDATKVQLLDVATTRSDFWVNSVSADHFTMEAGRLITNDVMTATVRLRTLSSLAAGTQLPQMVTFSNGDNDPSAPTQSNMTLVTIGASAQNQTIMPMDVVTWLAPVGRELRFSSAYFQPGELVTFWYTDATPKDTFVETIRTGDDGMVRLNFDSGVLRPGFFTMLAHGQNSGLMARVNFEMQANLGTVDVVVMPDGHVVWRETMLGGGDVAATLIWNRSVDLNLIVVDPNGAVVSQTAVGSAQARMDSMNGCSNIIVGRPENIYWPAGTAPKGAYQVYVDYVDGCGEDEDTPYTVRVMVNGTEYLYGGTIGPDDARQSVAGFQLR